MQLHFHLHRTKDFRKGLQVSVSFAHNKLGTKITKSIFVWMVDCCKFYDKYNEVLLA